MRLGQPSSTETGGALVTTYCIKEMLGRVAGQISFVRPAVQAALRAVARSVRRLVFAGLLDWSISQSEIEEALGPVSVECPSAGM